MDVDPDAMWKPGFGGHSTAKVVEDPAPPQVPLSDGAPGASPDSSSDRVAGSSSDREAGSPSDSMARSRRVRSGVRAKAVGAGIAIVAAGALIAVFWDRSSPDRPDVGAIGAASEHHLPDAVEELWSTRLPGTGAALATNIEIDGRELVVVVVDDGSRDRAGVVGLDALTGAIRWHRSFSFAPPEVRIIGIIGDRLVLEQVNPSTRQLLGLSTADGSTVWQRQGSVSKLNVMLDGSDVITQLPVANPFNRDEANGDGANRDEIEAQVTFVDPMDGVDLGETSGRLLSTDLAGTWFFGDDNAITSVDLSAGWTTPVEISNTGIGLGDQLSVIDDRLIVISGRGFIAELGTDTETIADLTLLATTTSGELPVITSVFPAGGQTFVGVGDGVVVGAELDGDDVRRTWEMGATMRNFAVTERGLVLTVSSAGQEFVEQADLDVVDAVTGMRLATSGPTDDSDKLPVIVADGFVLTDEEGGETERTGFDLDGTKLWTLSATGKLRVGDEIIVTLNNTPSGFHVTAYGATPVEE